MWQFFADFGNPPTLHPRDLSFRRGMGQVHARDTTHWLVLLGAVSERIVFYFHFVQGCEGKGVNFNGIATFGHKYCITKLKGL